MQFSRGASRHPVQSMFCASVPFPGTKGAHLRRRGRKGAAVVVSYAYWAAQDVTAAEEMSLII